MAQKFQRFCLNLGNDCSAAKTYDNRRQDAYHDAVKMRGAVLSSVAANFLKARGVLGSVRDKKGRGR
jgi:hypothetical protein